MPELSEEQKEMVELAQVILEEFPDASEMTDEELENEVFLGQDDIEEEEDYDDSFDDEDFEDIDADDIETLKA